MSLNLQTLHTLLISLAATPFATALVADESTTEVSSPIIAAASDDGKNALRGFRIPSSLRGQLFAAEPMVANPVAFHVDHQGRVFVCETFRQNAGVTDNRAHDSKWVDDDLAAQTVEGRLDYHKKHLGESVVDYARQEDRIRLLVDADGDGQADQATVFADRFHSIVTGTGAGVLSYRGNVYYTCIPHLWRLRDDDGDGKADEKESLHEGYGVRVAFRGHDLHGLTMGPDGRLYFSIGDRGYHIVTENGTLADPESGAVFRCELDGSKLEVVATGLRNPQELAFDDHGNLFTGDNNSDSGDRARWVYVVEGGDSGWRMAYQYLADRGPFNREKLWHPYHKGQPAYIVPPVTNIADGPSGLAYYPGTGLGEDFAGRFLLCDFRGGAANSGIRSFRAEPKGAFFEVADEDQPFWNILATDVQFGPDGAIYVSDWVNGWVGEGTGRIYRFANPSDSGDPLVAEVRELLAGDLREFGSDRLVTLLGHADRRVRLEAQFALAAAGADARLIEAAAEHANHLARLHAIWGLGQIARSGADSQSAIVTKLAQLTQAGDAEVRAQAVRLLGEVGNDTVIDEVIGLLSDEQPRVRYFAATSVGKLAATAGFDRVLQLLESNADEDPVLRHGGIMALVGIGDEARIAGLHEHPSVSVRIAAVVALRKLRSPLVAKFLPDPNAGVVVESVRAIHDVPIESAMPTLARLKHDDLGNDAVWRRVLNANYRLGAPGSAQAIAQVAASKNMPKNIRLEAIQMLSNWESPGSRDRVLGMWRPVDRRSPDSAATALKQVLSDLVDSDSEIQLQVALAAAALRLPQAATIHLSIVRDTQQSGANRARSLSALSDLEVTGLESIARDTIDDAEPAVRAASLRILAKTNIEEALPKLQYVLEKGKLVERQAALETLVKLDPRQSTPLIVDAMRTLVQGSIPLDMQLDVLEAAAKSSSPEIQQLLSDFEDGRANDTMMTRFLEVMYGGDADKGAAIFFERTEVSCVRCHKVNGRGGEVGPDLSEIAKEKRRTYLVESIVDPNATIAKGYESAMVLDADGLVHVGVVRSESDDTLQLITAEGKTVTINKDDIDARKPSKSPMPEDLVKKMSKRELRDLIEYLSSLK